MVPSASSGQALRSGEASLATADTLSSVVIHKSSILWNPH
jgi:hypothetical protein